MLTLVINWLKNIMEKDKTVQEDFQYEVDTSRASVFGHKTSDHELTQNIVNTIIDSHHYLDIQKFVKVLQTYPNIKQQTKLVEKVFSNRMVIEDMVRFLVNPQKVISKYNLKEIEARRFINPIKEFINNNYQFYQHFFINVQKSLLDYYIWFQFLQNKINQTYHSCLGYLQDVFIPIVKYEYSSTSRVSEFYQHHYNTQKTILIISNFTQKTITLLIRHTQYSSIFKTIFNIILASLQELQWKKSLNLLKQLCLSSIDNEHTLDTHIEHVYWMVKEVSNNIQKDVHNTIFAFINAFVQSNFVRVSINRISSILLNYGQAKIEHPIGINQETALQFNIKMLAQLINIYYLLRKIGIDYMATQMLKLKANIDQIYNYINTLMVSMRNIQTKSVKFSNGQNIKICLLSRFQVLNLLKISLLLNKQYGQTIPQFQNKIDKSLVFEFLIACMSRNRWNNIVQCLIQKIICIIVCPQMFKTNNTSIHKFLKFIVQTFSNKKYMFLDSAKMINQGDIHFLYFISRKITVQLDRLPGIIQISSQYDFWKKFVLNVLQKYQNTNDRLSKISQTAEIYDRAEKDQDFKVEIDQLASIKEIVKKFDVNQKWTFKGQSQKYALPRVGSAQNLIPKIPHQKSEKATGSPNVIKSGINNIKQKKSHGLQSGIQLIKTQSHYESPSGQMDLYHETSSHSDSEVSHDEEIMKKELKY